MLRQGTKDRHELETDETERLIRPSPKDKPKRTDLRREEVLLDRDPDIDADPDLKGDPDSSMNYKTIGGSLESRILGRFLRADLDRSKLIRVKKKDTGNITHVTKERLQEEPGSYDIMDDSEGEEETPSKEELSKPKEETHHEEVHPEPVDHEDAVHGLKAESASNPAFANALKSFADPKGFFAGLPKEYPISQIKGMSDHPAIKPFKTIGDLRKAIQDLGATKPTKEPKAPAKKVDAPRVETPKIEPTKDPVRTEPEPPKSETTKEEPPAAKEEEPSKKEAPQEKAPPKPKDGLKPLTKPILRRPTTKDERDRALMHIVENFPPDVAKTLMNQKLHPDDVGELVSSFHLAKEAKPKNVDQALKMIGGVYQTDPAKITKPPKFGNDSEGNEHPFDSLSPEDQDASMRKHRLRTVALSLAARDSLLGQMESKTGAPEELLGKVVDFTLSRPKDESPSQRMHRGQVAAKNAFQDEMAKSVAPLDTSRWEQDEDLEPKAKKPGKLDEEHDEEPEKQDEPIPPEKEISSSQVRKLLEALAGDPAAQQIAVGHLQGQDYHAARQKYLDSDSEDTISEYQAPRDIWNGVKNAVKFIREREDRYPPELSWANDPAKDFRRRVLDKVKTLAPEKYHTLKKWDEDFEDDEYKTKSKEWEKAFSEKSPYRIQGLIPPDQPRPPLGYENRTDDPKDLKKQRKDLFEEHRRQMGLDDEEEPRSVQARVLRRFCKYSSYPKRLTMAQNSKTSVYWGIDPQKTYDEVGLYPEPNLDPEKHDLTDGKLIKQAQTWLESPVLSTRIAGVSQDSQLRAALDLAVRDVGTVTVKTYEHTLTSLRVACRCSHSDLHDSLYAPVGEEEPMKASAQIRSFAARVASENPNLAYDLLELSSVVANEEQQEQSTAEQDKQGGEVPPQFLEHMKEKKDDAKEDEGQGQQKEASYQTLRSAVIKMAYANRHLSEAYLPLLQTIKEIG